MIALVTMTFLTPLRTTSSVETQNDPSAWYDSSWIKRRPITINNTLNSNSLVGYQVRIEVNYDSDMKSNFSDLRFTVSDGVTLIPYWIETYTASVSAIAWVRVPTIPASNVTTIYMYYDNPSAGNAENGTDTFEFFDDFSGSVLNSSKWTEDAVGDITHTVNNYFRFEDAADSVDAWIYGGADRGSQHQANWTPLSQFIIEFTSKINDVTPPETGQGFLGIVATDNTVIGVAGYQDYQNSVAANRAVVTENTASSVGNGVSQYGTIAYTGVSPTDTTSWRIIDNGNTMRFYDDDGFFAEATASSSVSKLALVAGTYASSTYLDFVQMNDMRVRKYTSPEPSSFTGLEEDYRMKGAVAWWDPAWTYRKPVNLTENAGSSLSNYQVKLIVDYDASMKPDFSDLRFTDSDQITLIPHFTESYTASVSAQVWVNVPSIPASSNKTIYMYYGNPAASDASDGTATFDFFDDFETAYGGPSLWTEKQSLPQPKADPAAAVYNGKIYVFGGYYFGTGDVRRETYEYDPSSNSWTRKADMPTARWGPIAVEFNGLIYVFSGTVNVNEVYNATADTWTTRNPLPFYSDQGLMAARYGDRIHLFYNFNHYEYDPATDSYSQKASMPTPRTWAACAVIGSKIYLIGGYVNQVGEVNVNEVYDPASDNWTTLAPMPVSKWGGGREQPVINGRIYVTHGRSLESSYVNNYVYDPLTNSWEQKSPAVHPRAGSAAAVVDNKLYVIGGVVIREGEIHTGLDFNEQYDPATDTWIESPWNFSNSSKVKRDPSAKYEGNYGMLIYEDVETSPQYAEHSQSYSTFAVDLYWNVTDAFGIDTAQPQGRILLADSSNPSYGSLYYYHDSGAKFYWYRDGTYTFLQNGSWNSWYLVTIIWNGANSRVIINGAEHSVSAAQMSSDRIYISTYNHTEMFVDVVRTRKYVYPSPSVDFGAEEEPATIESCDSDGTVKDSFRVSEALYVKGRSLKPNTLYNLYVVNDAGQWYNGKPIPTHVPGTAFNVSSDDFGNIQPAMVWGSTVVGNYDIVLDVYENGFYDIAFDALDLEVEVIALHDVAVLGLSPSKTVVGSGYSILINVTVENQGDFAENFDLTVYANSTPVATQVVNLANGEVASVSFIWNTTEFAKSNYTVKAYATPLPSEIDTEDNIFFDGTVKVTWVGDVQGDGDVDSDDLLDLWQAYGSTSTSPNWHPNCDINSDDKVDEHDLFNLGKNYGKT